MSDKQIFMQILVRLLLEIKLTASLVPDYYEQSAFHHCRR